MDEGKAVDIVYFGAGKAVSTVSHNIFIDKLIKYKLGKCGGLSEASGLKSCDLWQNMCLDTSHQESIPWVDPETNTVNLFINALDDGLGCTLRALCRLYRSGKNS